MGFWFGSLDDKDKTQKETKKELEGRKIVIFCHVKFVMSIVYLSEDAKQASRNVILEFREKIWKTGFIFESYHHIGSI